MIKAVLEREFDFEGSEYADLFDNSGATAFQHPIWMAEVVQTLAPKLDATPLTIAIRQSDDGHLIGTLPLMLLRRHGVKIVEFADFGVTDYCAPVIRNGCQERVHKQLILPDQLTSAIGPHDIIRVKSVRPEHVTLVEQITGTGPNPAGFSAHEAPLEQPYPEWRAKAFSRSHIKYIDRKRRRFERLGETKFEHVSEPDAARAAIGELKNLRAGRFEGDPIQQNCVEDFYARIAE